MAACEKPIHVLTYDIMSGLPQRTNHLDPADCPPMSRRCSPSLPHNWPESVKSAVLHTISMAQYGLAYSRGWAADSRNGRLRVKAKLDRANQEIALLREEMRIKDARMARIDPHRRPHYPPVERMAILQCQKSKPTAPPLCSR